MSVCRSDAGSVRDREGQSWWRTSVAVTVSKSVWVDGAANTRSCSVRNHIIVKELVLMLILLVMVSLVFSCLCYFQGLYAVCALLIYCLFFLIILLLLVPSLFSPSQLHSIKPSKLTDDCQAALPCFLYLFLFYLWRAFRLVGNTCHS